MLWLDVVNEAFEWVELADVRQALGLIVGPQPISNADAQSFWDTMRFIRRQIAIAHFGKSLDLNQLKSRVSQIKLEFVLDGGKLPALRAAASGATPVKQLEQTIFLQFALYLSELESLPEEQRLKRCESLYRPDKKLSLSNDEQRWRSEIPELAESSVDDLQRCGDFFTSPKARFCSESCRTRAFQIVKQLKDPNYLAEKQRRYRQRKSAR